MLYQNKYFYQNNIGIECVKCYVVHTFISEYVKTLKEIKYTMDFLI